ncbi:MAG: hypothetical protein JWM31_773, partial [Solirubrobacterales bacterium]|nr:hypothetical protein [Solirubrobacterales bacterium]
MSPLARRPLLAAVVTAAAFGLAPAAHAKGTLYVAGAVAAPAVDAQAIGAGGALTAIPPATGAGAIGASRGTAMTPDGRRLYVAGAAGAVAAFAVDPAGALSAIAGSPFATTVTSSRGIAVTPDGRFLYVGDEGGGNGAVSIFAIGTGGALSLVAEPPFPGSTPEGIAVSPDGRTLYVANVPAGKVSSFAIGADGKLTATGTPAVGGGEGIAVTPNGAFVLSANKATNTITSFRAAADGTLTAVGSQPTGAVPATVAVTPDGRFAFVADFGTAAPGRISGYALDATGTLTPLPGSPFATFDLPYGLAASPAGRLYSASFDAVDPGRMNGFALGGDGGLSALGASPFTSQVHSAEFQSVVIRPNQGPAAGALAAGPAPAGQATSFGAATATDPDGGSVARYDWDFGDGQSLPNGGAAPAHVYAAAGTYTASVTVTDEESCSTTVLFT